MRQNIFSVRDICEIALISAIAIVLGFFCEIRIGQNGGSIGFSMIPLLFICYRHGLIKGFIASGIIYGLASCIYDGYGLHCYPFEKLRSNGRRLPNEADADSGIYSTAKQTGCG